MPIEKLRTIFQAIILNRLIVPEWNPFICDVSRRLAI